MSEPFVNRFNNVLVPRCPCLERFDAVFHRVGNNPVPTRHRVGTVFAVLGPCWHRACRSGAVFHRPRRVGSVLPPRSASLNHSITVLGPFRGRSGTVQNAGPDVRAPCYNRVGTYLKSLSSSLPQSTDCLPQNFHHQNLHHHTPPTPQVTSLMATSIQKRRTYVPVGADCGPPVKTCFVCEMEFATNTQPLEQWGYRTCRRCRRNNIEFCSVYCRMVDHDNFINIAPCNQCQASDREKQ